jgi:RNA 3'-terminal phosphate cyclase (ATP)
MIEIDGSSLEGGGQILRISSSLAAVLNCSIRIRNIRGGRPKPGLAAQHLAGLQLVSELINTSINGLQLKSQEVSIKRSHDVDELRIHSGVYTINVGTAGSITLVLQSALPIAIFAISDRVDQAVELTITGGTDVDHAPCYDYFHYVLLPTLRDAFNLQITSTIQRRGLHPKGGGRVHVQIQPITGCLPPIIRLDAGVLESVTLHVFTAGIKFQADNIKLRMLQVARELLAAFSSSIVVHVASEVLLVEGESFSDGFGITIVAKSTTGCLWGAGNSGSKSSSAEKLTREVVEELLVAIRSGAVVDVCMQDQVIVFMTLAEGISKIRIQPSDITLHTQTAMAIATQISGARFWWEDDDQVLCCKGVGKNNKVASTTTSS